jgi:hypothetical protein
MVTEKVKAEQPTDYAELSNLSTIAVIQCSIFKIFVIDISL